MSRPLKVQCIVMIQFVPCFVLYWDGDGKVAQLLVFNGESTATVVSGHGKKKKSDTTGKVGFAIMAYVI